MSRENDYQAFPFTPLVNEVFYPGMTLRDYFAGEALNALVGSSKPGGWNVGPTGSDNAWLAATSYALADAMLSERNKERVQ